METIELCKLAQKNLKQVGDQDKMLVGVIQLLLAASEIRWRGKPELQGELQLKALAEEAKMPRYVLETWHYLRRHNTLKVKLLSSVRAKNKVYRY